jgi:sugar/nucleoside kinase (ribokinase family)
VPADDPLLGEFSFADALRWAATAGSLSVDRAGTHDSYPSLDEIAVALGG